jgi:hypothetical protein
MKKFSVTALLFIICFSLAAQYKKASFFGKDGRTYGAGAQLYAMGDGKGSPIGYVVTFGRDRDGKQFFSSWELQVIPSYKFSFATTDVDDQPLVVSGTSKTHLVYAVNYGYYLLKNDDESRKVKPYVSAGFNIVMLGGIKTANNDNYDNKKPLSSETFSGGLKGGVGCFYNLSPKFSLKFDGGYNYQFNMSTDSYLDDSNAYFMFTSHPYVSLGIRFRVVKE